MNNSLAWIRTLLPIVMLSLLTACGGGTPTAGRVAVIDLDEIAKATGKNNDIRDALADMVKQRETQLGKLQSDLSAQVDAEKEKLGEKPSDKEKQSLQEMVNKARAELRNSVVQAKQEAQNFKLKLISEFKQEVLPVAVKVATQKNYSVVLVKGPSLFYIGPEADITQAVIKELAPQSK